MKMILTTVATLLALSGGAANASRLIQSDCRV
jgi:hypothetical protein